MSSSSRQTAEIFTSLCIPKDFFLFVQVGIVNVISPPSQEEARQTDCRNFYFLMYTKRFSFHASRNSQCHFKRHIQLTPACTSAWSSLTHKPPPYCLTALPGTVCRCLLAGGVVVVLLMLQVSLVRLLVVK